jgi:hypothetical protein
VWQPNPRYIVASSAIFVLRSSANRSKLKSIFSASTRVSCYRYSRINPSLFSGIQGAHYCAWGRRKNRSANRFTSHVAEFAIHVNSASVVTNCVTAGVLVQAKTLFNSGHLGQRQGRPCLLLRNAETGTPHAEKELSTGTSHPRTSGRSSRTEEFSCIFGFTSLNTLPETRRLGRLRPRLCPSVLH